MIRETQTGTVILNGIEYNEYPPPQQLVKVMEQKWAEQLVSNGSVRFHRLEYHQNLENETLGDINEGMGLYHLDGHPMLQESVNDVYIWCLSLPIIQQERLLLLAQARGYDCAVRVRAPEVFFTRVRDWLSNHRNEFPLHCGHVNYNRGEEVTKETLNSQKFHYNVFQKAPRFKDDMEYRMSITNYTFSCLPDHIDLLLGDCSDIISIGALPNKSVDPTA